MKKMIFLFLSLALASCSLSDKQSKTTVEDVVLKQQSEISKADDLKTSFAGVYDQQMILVKNKLTDVDDNKVEIKDEAFKKFNALMLEAIKDVYSYKFNAASEIYKNQSLKCTDIRISLILSFMQQEEISDFQPIQNYLSSLPCDERISPGLLSKIYELELHREYPNQFKSRSLLKYLLHLPEFTFSNMLGIGDTGMKLSLAYLYKLSKVCEKRRDNSTVRVFNEEDEDNSLPEGPGYVSSKEASLYECDIGQTPDDLKWVDSASWIWEENNFLRSLEVKPNDYDLMYIQNEKLILAIVRLGIWDGKYGGVSNNASNIDGYMRYSSTTPEMGILEDGFRMTTTVLPPLDSKKSTDNTDN